jgi:hypothetical protein
MSPWMASGLCGAHADHVAPLITPQRHAGSSREAGSFAEAPSPWRDALTATGGNKQETSNSGIQPPSTIISITWIHARSGQPLAVTLNGTVRVLTYKQEVAGSSPSPPIARIPANESFRRFAVSRPSSAGCGAAGNKQLFTQPPLTSDVYGGSRRSPASRMPLARPPQCARPGMLAPRPERASPAPPRRRSQARESGSPWLTSARGLVAA